MIQNEKQLKKIIKETLLLTEVGKELDNVISGFEKEFKKAGKLGEGDGAIRAIRKNNTLLELILLLVDIPGIEFEEFYKNSNLIPTENDDEFWKKQKKCRTDDQTKLKSLINSFIKEIKDTTNKTKTAKDFLNKLSELKSELNNYIPKWHVLQYLFFHIDNEGFGEVLNDFCIVAENFETPIAIVKGFQIPKEDKMSDLLEKVKKSINNNGLTEDDKKQILSETVASEDFQSGIERGEWGWLTGAIDSAVNFFFPDIRSVTNEVEGFFENFEKAAGGKKNVKKVMDKLTKNVTIQSLLNKMGAGQVSEGDIEQAASVIRNIAVLMPGYQSNNRP